MRTGRLHRPGRVPEGRPLRIGPGSEEHRGHQHPRTQPDPHQALRRSGRRRHQSPCHRGRGTRSEPDRREQADPPLRAFAHGRPAPSSSSVTARNSARSARSPSATPGATATSTPRPGQEPCGPRPRGRDRNAQGGNNPPEEVRGRTVTPPSQPRARKSRPSERSTRAEIGPMWVPVNDRRDLPVGAGRIAVGLMGLERGGRHRRHPDPSERRTRSAPSTRPRSRTSSCHPSRE